MKQISLFIISLLIFTSVSGQSICDSLSFIHCQKNTIQINDSIRSKLTKILESGNIKIVHIGDSHLQAAFFTEKVKQLLYQHFQENEMIASPGFIFPFSMAQTNNPYFFKVSYTGQWLRSKNVDEIQNSQIGISGITVSTSTPQSELKIKMQNQKYNFKTKYFFDKVILLHNIDSSINISANNRFGNISNIGSTWEFNEPIDSIQFSFSNSDTSKNLELYGLILEKKNSNVQYHTIGVNGSMAHSYLKCSLFENHLKLLDPNIVILSLGTNEAYNKDFNREEYIFNLTSLISKIHNTNPNAILLIATPNDHLKNGVINNNIAIVNESIYSLTNYFSFGIWDFYKIMGGSGSINNWYKKQLTSEDRLHFNRKGYEIQGELLYNALIQLIHN